MDIKINTDNFYNNVFLKAPQRKQKEFLFSLFSQNEEICKQFYLFMYPPPPPLSNTFGINELSNEIAEIINNIDIEDYRKDEDYDDYDDEYSDFDDYGFEETLKESLNVYQTRITQQSEKGNWLDSAKIMLAVYEAAYLVENPTSEYFEDTWVTNMVLAFFDTLVENWTAEAEKKLPKEAAAKVLSLIFERRSVFARFSHKPNTPYVMLKGGLASLMESCLNEGVYAKETLAWLKKEELMTFQNIDFVKFIYASNNSDEEFGKILDKFYHKGEPVERRLMDFYLDNNKRADFVRVAKKDFEDRKMHFDFIQKKLLQTDDELFFKAVTREKLFRKKEIADYEILKKILDSHEILALAKEARKKYLDLFIKIATYEKDYPTLLQVAQEQKDRFNINLMNSYFENAIQPILNVYPIEIFDMCKERILKTMSRGAQGREYYAAAIKIIKPLKKIETQKTELANLVAVLRKTHYRLPAFLDELKKAGF